MKGYNIWCEVVCERCACADIGSFYRKGCMDYLKKAAKQKGWKVVNGRTLCPDCLKEINKEKDAKGV